MINSFVVVKDTLFMQLPDIKCSVSFKLPRQRSSECNATSRCCYVPSNT
jgi:hypothetical protein